MRTVTLEEHVTFPELVAEVKKLSNKAQSKATFGAMAQLASKLEDISGERLTSMNEQGITVQVLSVVGVGANLVEGQDGIDLAKKYNDTIAERIKAYPDRFSAFAHLPMLSPQAAADELERTVKNLRFKDALINGMTDDEFLDNPKYAPILERAQQLDVPIYLHPGMPPEAVANVYYSELPKDAGQRLSIAGWGWHSETALHVLRMIVAGTFDKYPKLKLIIGHMGEMLPVMMARCDTIFKPGEAGNNQRSISQTLKDQVYITTSGIFTEPPLTAAIATFGIDRILYSVDYPFATNEVGKKFLSSLQLSNEDMETLAHGNADKLLKLTP
jgi:predicted TIM-barrel fold metal-dependent hydrolase